MKRVSVLALLSGLAILVLLGRIRLVPRLLEDEGMDAS